MSIEYRIEILTASLEAREKEVDEYQVNIDNYNIALEQIGDDPNMQEFKNQIQNLLQSSVIEQKKAQLILNATQVQLDMLKAGQIN